MDENTANQSSSEASKVSIPLVIIVAILLCIVLALSSVVFGNPVIALFGLAVIVPLATVLVLHRNRSRILDQGNESARDREI